MLNLCYPLQMARNRTIGRPEDGHAEEGRTEDGHVSEHSEHEQEQEEPMPAWARAFSDRVQAGFDRIERRLDHLENWSNVVNTFMATPPAGRPATPPPPPQQDAATAQRET